MNFKGVKTFWENLRNSPKFSLGVIFTKVNLVGTLVCKNFELQHMWHAPSHRTAATSEGIDAGMHQIIVHKTPSIPRRIPPPRQGMQDPQEHGR
jgi:hypothetical protein